MATATITATGVSDTGQSSTSSVTTVPAQTSYLVINIGGIFTLNSGSSVGGSGTFG